MKRIILLLLFLTSTTSFGGAFHPTIDYVFPRPESKFITIHTTIILKLDATQNDQITDLSNLISVQSENESIAGRTFFATDERTIIFQPNKSLPQDAKIDVTIQTSQFGSDDFSYSFYTASENRNEMDWLPKLSTPVNKVLAPEPVRMINGVAVPSDFPNVSVNIIGETAPGRLFIPASKWIIIFENDGTPYFYRKYEDGRNKMRFQPQATGYLSFFSHEVYDVILDQNFVEIDTVTPGHGYLPDDHELQILENGHMLLVARDHVRVDMSKVISGGDNNATVEAHHVQELDRDRNVIFEWNNWEHLDIRESTVPIRGGFVDFVHTNSIAVDYDGHLIVSPREYNTVMKIDRVTAETIWKLGGDDSDFEFINDDIDFSRIHDVRPVPGKPNHYTLFDNGRDRNHGGQFSRGVEYKLDTDAMTAEKVWEYRHNPDLFSSYCGGLQPLANGNRFISWANHDYFTEINSSGELVYEMHVSGFSCSRARREEWDGMMLQPYLLLENMGNVIRLIFNKFGDADVKAYRVYGGTSENTMNEILTTTNTYADLTDLNNNTYYFFKVSAVNSAGQESDFSEVVSTLVRVLEPGSNMIVNGDFSNDDQGWIFHARNGAAAAGRVNDSEFHVEIESGRGGSSYFDIQLIQESFPMVRGRKYVFEFDAWADANRVIEPRVAEKGGDWTVYSNTLPTAITRQPKQYRFEFEMTAPTNTEARVVLNCGDSDVDCYFDNVSVRELVPGNVQHNPEMPETFELTNYPNPFNPGTTISYKLAADSDVKLQVFDIRGRLVQTLVDGHKSAGVYSIDFRTKNISSGVYIYKLTAGNYSQSRKMLLVR